MTTIPGPACRFARCPDCDAPTHVHRCLDGTDVPLAPRRYPSGLLPPVVWRHLVHGVIRLGADPVQPGSVMIEHAEICAARGHTDLLARLRGAAHSGEAA